MKKLFKLGFVSLLLSTLIVTSGCYKKDIDDLEDRVTKLETSFSDLQKTVDKLGTAVISAEWANGILTLKTADNKTVTCNIGSMIPSYDIKLDGNTLYVNNVAKGSVTLPTASMFTVKDGYLYYNNTKTAVAIPQNVSLDLKVVAENGMLVFYNGTTKLGASVPEVKVVDGVLYIAGVAQTIDSGITKDHNVQFVKVGDKLQAVYVEKDGEKFYVTLYNALDGLIFMPDLYVGGIPTIEFYRIKAGASAAATAIFESVNDVTFRTNPGNADISSVTSWKFYNRAVETRSTSLESDNLVTRVGEARQIGGAVQLTVTAKHNNTKAAGTKKDFIVLEAELGQPGYKTIVTSDEVQVNLVTITNVAIMDPVAANTPAKYVYPTKLAVTTGSEYGAKNTGVPARHVIPYTQGTFNLNDYVTSNVDMNNIYVWNTYPNNTGIVTGTPNWKSLDALKISNYYYTFTKVEEYVIPGDPTDQQTFVSAPDANGIVTIQGTTSAVGRKPIFKAELKNAAGVVMATAFIKFEIGKKVIPTVELTVDYGDINYLDLFNSAATYTTKGLTWQVMNAEVYEKYGLTHNQFVAKYTTTAALVYDHATGGGTNTGNGNLADLGKVVSFSGATPGTGTVLHRIEIDPQTRFGQHSWSVTYTPTLPIDLEMYPSVKVTFKFNLTKPAAAALSPNYASANTVTTKGYNKNASGFNPNYAMEFGLREAFVNYLADYNTAVVNKIVSQTSNYGTTGSMTNDFNFQPSTTTTGAAITGGSNYMNQILGLTTTLSEPSRTYSIRFTNTFQNTGWTLTDFKVVFENPFTWTILPMELETLTTPTSLNVTNYLKLTFGNDNIVLFDGSKKGQTGFNSDGFATGTYGALYYLGGTSLTLDNRFTYTLNTTPATDNRLTRSGSTVTWNNLGGTLLQDITSETVSVTVTPYGTTPYATATGTGVVKLLKSK